MDQDKQRIIKKIQSDMLLDTETDSEEITVTIKVPKLLNEIIKQVSQKILEINSNMANIIIEGMVKQRWETYLTEATLISQPQVQTPQPTMNFTDLLGQLGTPKTGASNTNEALGGMQQSMGKLMEMMSMMKKAQEQFSSLEQVLPKEEKDNAKD